MANCPTCLHHILGGILYPGTRYEPPSHADDFCECDHDLDEGCNGEDYEAGQPQEEDDWAAQNEADNQLHYLRDTGQM